MNRSAHAGFGVALFLALMAGSPAWAQTSQDGRLTGSGSKELAQTKVDPTMIYNQGVRHLEDKNYKAAEQAFRDVLDRTSTSAAANYMMGLTQIALDNLPLAKSYLTAAVKSNDKAPDPRGRLGWVLAKLGDGDGAAEQRAALEKLNTSCKGTCPEAAGIRDALALIDGAVKPAAPVTMSAAARFNQGVDFINAQKFAEARAAFQDVVNAKPADHEARMYLGVAHAALGEFAPAREALSAALAAQPGMVEARGWLGFVEAKSGNPAAAAEQRQKLIDAKTSCGSCSAAPVIDSSIARIDSAG